MAQLKKITLFLLGIFFIGKFCIHQTGGFSLQKIQSNLSYHPEWELDATISDGILDQPYFYLGSGAQAFAFASQDGKWVIKFFRHHRASHPLSPLIPVLPTAWKRRLYQTIKKRECKRIKDFTSYLIAFNELKEDTGLLYLHLNKTNTLKKTLTLYDKIKVRHHLNLDDYEFLIQRRATPLCSALEEWIEEGRVDLAQTGLSQLVALLKRRIEKGIFDKDPDLKTNFGMIGTTPIQYDIGRFKTGIEMDKDALIRITDRLAHWLDKRSPELGVYLRSEVKKA